MFDRFGEFDSVEELNRAAEGLKEEGDISGLIELAEENGLDKADAEDYMDGMIPELANKLIAALGKIKIERQSLKPVNIMEDWVSYIELCAGESEEMAAAIRRKNKNLKGCIAELLKWSFKNQHSIDKEILRAAGVNAGRVTLGIPGMGTAKKIIREYYLGGK